MEYTVGHIFEGIYPPEAARWCDEGQQFHIEEIESVLTKTDPMTGDTVPVRRFMIVENQPQPEPTPEEIAALENADMIDAMPDAVADLSEQVSINATSNAELADAIADLSMVVSNFAGSK